MTTTDPITLRDAAVRAITEDRVPTDVLAALVAEYGDEADACACEHGGDYPSDQHHPDCPLWDGRAPEEPKTEWVDCESCESRHPVGSSGGYWCPVVG